MKSIRKLVNEYGPYKTREMIARGAIVLATAYLFLFNIGPVWTEGADALDTTGNYTALALIALSNAYLLRLWAKHDDMYKVRKWMVKAVPILAGAAALAAYYWWAFG